MEFLTIVTKYDIFIGDIVKCDSGYYCVSLDDEKPQVLDEVQYNDFKHIIFTIYNYKLIKDGVNDD